MTPVLVRPARSVDADALTVLAALDSAAPLTGEVLLAVAGGEVAAAMSLDTGAVVADPFEPTAHLVDLLRTAAHPEPQPPPAQPALRAARRPRRLAQTAHSTAPGAFTRGPFACAVRLRPPRLAA